MAYRSRILSSTSNEKYVNTFTAAANATTEITKTIPITTEDSEAITVDIVYSAATKAGTTFEFRIESSSDGGANWDFTNGSVAAATAAARTVASIDLNMKRSGDQASLPIRPQMRIVFVSDNAGDAMVVDSISISHRS